MVDIAFIEGVLDKIIQADKALFYFINTQFTNPTLDGIFPWWRESTTWVPFYVFLLAFMFINFGKNAWPWILFVLFNVLLSDQISSTFFKHYFMRLRPCSDPQMQFQVRLLLDHCSGGFSFTSSHATNHVAFAVFVIKTLKSHIQPYGWLLLVWAASIAYGQVYVGVHYPLDIIGGALIGIVIGNLTSSVYNRRIAPYYSLFEKDAEPEPTS